MIEGRDKIDGSIKFDRRRLMPALPRAQGKFDCLHVVIYLFHVSMSQATNIWELCTMIIAPKTFRVWGALETSVRLWALHFSLTLPT